MADPSDNGLLQDLKFITRFDLFPVLAGEYTLRNLIEKYYDASDQSAQLQDILKDMEGLGLTDDLERSTTTKTTNRSVRRRSTTRRSSS